MIQLPIRLPHAVFLAGLTAFAAYPAYAQQNSAASATSSMDRVIKVSGSGEASAPPDMATLGFTVAEQAQTTSEALSANNASMNDIMEAMQEAGIAENDLRTTGFSIEPQYVCTNDDCTQPRRIDSYIVRNGLMVTVHDISQVGTLLQRAVDLGFNEGGSIDFSHENPDGLLAEARRSAVADARSKAETLAEAAGLSLGPILSITEGGGDGSPQPLMRSAIAAEGVPIASGENSYRVTVELTVAIDEVENTTP